MSDTLSFNVVLIGFSNLETIKLEKILGLTKSRKIQYFPQEEWEAKGFQIVMANADNWQSVARAEKLASECDAALVLVGGKSEMVPKSHFIAKPIMSIRVIGALDALITSSDAASEPSATAQQQALACSSQPGQYGTLANAAPGDVQAPLPPQKLDGLDSHKHTLRVLAVDDSPLIHKSLNIELSQIGREFSIDFALSGEEALEFVRREPVYDMIFLDIMMPGISGHETCQLIRQDPRYRNNRKPIIMLSSKTSMLEQMTGFFSGCTTYLTKPIEHSEFQKMLLRVVDWLDQQKPRA